MMCVSRVSPRRHQYSVNKHPESRVIASSRAQGLGFRDWGLGLSGEVTTKVGMVV